jgi:hypothetical protein
MYSIESLHALFGRNNVGYWIVVDAHKRRVAYTSQDLTDIQDSEKQYADFITALELLNDGQYTVVLRTKMASNKNDMPFSFYKGDAIGNTVQPATRMATDYGNGNSNMMMMQMMTMMQNNQKNSQDMMMLLMNNRSDSDKLLYDERLARVKVENQDLTHKAMGAIPHIPAIINSIAGMAYGIPPQMMPPVPPVAQAPVVPTPPVAQRVAVGRAPAAPNEKVELSEQQKQALELGKRINAAFIKIQQHFPGKNPMDVIEVVVAKLDDPITKGFINQMMNESQE